MTTPTIEQQRRERDALARTIARHIADESDPAQYAALLARFDELDQELDPQPQPEGDDQ